MTTLSSGQLMLEQLLGKSATTNTASIKKGNFMFGRVGVWGGEP